MKRRETNNIVIHGAYTPADMDIGVNEMRRWHTDPKPHGNGWTDIGYHAVIRRTGRIEIGRAWDQVGAHVVGHNRDSFGIVMVGGGSMLANLDVLLRETTGLPVMLAEDPLTAVAVGTGRCLDELRLLKEVTIRSSS